MRRRRGDNTIWSSSDGFSIVDAISISFCATYLYLVLLAIMKPDINPNIVEIQSNMNILMTTIIGGYFGDQIVHQFRNRNKPGSGNTLSNTTNNTKKDGEISGI